MFQNHTTYFVIYITKGVFSSCNLQKWEFIVREKIEKEPWQQKKRSTCSLRKKTCRDVNI